MIEYEKKLFLEKEEYYCLLEYLGKGKPIVKQKNYYFDTDDLAMYRHNVTCRIREKNGKYKGTIKQHISQTTQSEEIPISVRDGIHDNAFVDMNLKLQGELLTERCVVLKEQFYKVVLDKNNYLHHSDYELEIEYLPEYEKSACEVLQRIIDLLMYRIPTLTQEEISLRCSQAQHKSSRFFERKTNLY